MTITVRCTRTIQTLCIVTIVLATAGGIRAGGVLETVDITGLRPSPIAGEVLARVVAMKWDARQIPVKYRVNNSEDFVPNPLGAAFLTVADATTELQASFDAWNEVATSFIDMQIVGNTANPGLRGFDMVNEITFRTSAGFTAVASSPSVALIEDALLVDGDFLDNDADPDVSDAITVATDVDVDGDLEIPAGFYKAGTILDNDVQFNTKATNGYRFTIGAANADTLARSVDLRAIAVHEFGHSHGLSHSLNNQSSVAEAVGATMYPFVDTDDPASELGQGTLHADDVAFTSWLYQEGSAASGVAALQPGDVAFDREFGIITGELRHGVYDEPLAGGHVYAVNERTGAIASGAFSGNTELSFNLNSGALSIMNVPFSILDGRYVLPVAKGRYSIGVEPVDGTPVPESSVSYTTIIGAVLGQQNFNEEPANLTRGRRYGGYGRLSIGAGETRRRIDIDTSTDINIDNFGSRDFVGFTLAPAGRIYAVQIPAAQITAVAAGRPLAVKAMAFHTGVVDASVAPVFAEAILTTGTVRSNGTASLQLRSPLARVPLLIGQDDDLTPVFVRNGVALGQLVQLGIRFGVIENLFLVLRVPTPPPAFPGVSGRPPLIGLDGGVTPNDVPILGLSFVSDDNGVTFTRRTDFNFRFSLRFSELWTEETN